MRSTADMLSRLRRFVLLYHLFPNKRFLVLTHNKPLIHDLQSRFTRFEGKLPDAIEWHTFNKWCYHHWSNNPRWVEPLRQRQHERLVYTVWQRSLAKTSITERMLTSEIDWIKDQLPITRAGYLSADRRGRGFRLTGEQREQVYQAYAVYQETLQVQHAHDWGNIPS